MTLKLFPCSASWTKKPMTFEGGGFVLLEYLEGYVTFEEAITEALFLLEGPDLAMAVLHLLGLASHALLLLRSKNMFYSNFNFRCIFIWMPRDDRAAWLKQNASLQHVKFADLQNVKFADLQNVGFADLQNVRFAKTTPSANSELSKSLDEKRSHLCGHSLIQELIKFSLFALDKSPVDLPGVQAVVDQLTQLNRVCMGSDTAGYKHRSPERTLLLVCRVVNRQFANLNDLHPLPKCYKSMIGQPDVATGHAL